MIILQADISKVRRNRDFGRIEAVVSLVAKVQAGQPPTMIRLRTSVPTRGDLPLRQRLKADAARLARFMRPHPVKRRKTA